MTKKIVYKVLCDEYMKITRIFFEIKETGEQIEGTHQIEKWVNSLFKENEQLKSENEVMRRLIINISLQRDEFLRGARENANHVGKLKKENKELKQKVSFYKDFQKDARELGKENLDLSEELDYYKTKCASLETGLFQADKENEQLKSRIKEVTELLSEEVDLFSDKATEHDINAYMELKELDNKDAFYMATATKKAIRMLKELQE